ncbi:MAG: ABC transporter permease [Microscillaceae bacterium]|nr:ABC transporter permease [Microscillaceae bacterium]MDW8460273.1 ABC transporter permease [Cytophagales bacterium]
MNFQENIKESFRAIRANILRTILTGLIIAIGISSLVGILTAVDSIQASVNNSLANLGANAFDIYATGSRGGGRRGGFGFEKVAKPISFKQANEFKERYQKAHANTRVSIMVNVTGIAEAKYQSKKTNPNSRVVGVNEHYFAVKSFEIVKGRSYSTTELDLGASVAVIGSEIATTLFEKSNPLDKWITVFGNKYLVIGVLKETGSSMGGAGSDRGIYIPLENARRLLADVKRQPNYDITVLLSSTTDFEMAMSEATVLMRKIRQDGIGLPNSFEISRSETLASRLESITSTLRLGGFVIGAVTLLGAAIGLMNIMLVSVTERTREIGIRKALGATPFRIRQQFLIEAIVICQLGGFAGIVFGIGIGNGVAGLLGVTDFFIPWIWIIVSFIICVLVGVIAGYYPAHKASQLDPIESLRFE